MHMSSFSFSGKKFCTLSLIIVCLFTYIKAYAEDERQRNDNYWYTTVYLGQLTFNDLKEFSTFQTDFVPSYMLALAVGKEFWRYHDYFALELEGQLAKYFGNYTLECDTEECLELPPEKRARKTQDHMEINVAVVFRWLDFPWDQYIDTSFAVGEGLSYATEVPAVEENLHFETFGVEYQTSNLLNYLMFELSLSLSENQKWSLIARIHHRSSVFGLLADTNTGSNTIGVGLRYEFR
jgi:hypothetical protein